MKGKIKITAKMLKKYALITILVVLYDTPNNLLYSLICSILMAYLIRFFI